jgi:hypothetical protein
MWRSVAACAHATSRAPLTWVTRARRDVRRSNMAMQPSTVCAERPRLGPPACFSKRTGSIAHRTSYSISSSISWIGVCASSLSCATRVQGADVSGHGVGGQPGRTLMASAMARSHSTAMDERSSGVREAAGSVCGAGSECYFPFCATTARAAQRRAIFFSRIALSASSSVARCAVARSAIKHRGLRPHVLRSAPRRARLAPSCGRTAGAVCAKISAARCRTAGTEASSV